MQQVKTIEDLKERIENGQHDFFILLNGFGRSSKEVDYSPKTKKFIIVNEIDGTTQVLSEKNLFNRKYTNIGYAMENGAFYYYYDD